MREVLFRGFHECENGDTIITINERKIKGIWVYGYYCFSPKRRGAFGQTVSELDFDTHYIVSPRGESYKVIPETVGQCIGLPDKNGKKIFEGDICGCFCNTQVFIVEYCKDRCGYFFDDCIKSGGCDPAPECLGNLRDTIEVIGNIYDNPDLLEGISE